MGSPHLLSTPFGFSSTASEVIAGVDLSDRIALVTGASSGIGLETARTLAAAGAQVTLAVRDLEAGDRAAKEIERSFATARLHVRKLELVDPSSVAGFAAEWNGPLDILICNAGVMASPEQYTAAGWELQLATNHLGHFQLATLLHSALAAVEAARIVVVSSKGHMVSPVVFDDLNFDFRLYDPWLAYGQSKTANVLFAAEASRRWAADGITANSLMPGAVYTNLQRHTGGRGSGRVARELIKTSEQGAATPVLLAASPLLDGVTGRYFADCTEQPIVYARNADLGGVAHYALDQDNARRLWSASEQIVKAF